MWPDEFLLLVGAVCIFDIRSDYVRSLLGMLPPWALTELRTAGHGAGRINWRLTHGRTGRHSEEWVEVGAGNGVCRLPGDGYLRPPISW